MHQCFACFLKGNHAYNWVFKMLSSQLLGKQAESMMSTKGFVFIIIAAATLQIATEVVQGCISK